MKGEGLACALQISDTVRPFGRFLLQYPLLTTSLNHLTLILESVGPFLLFVPVYNQYFRSLAIFLFTSLQAAFGLSLYVMNFPPAMITGSMPFIPSFWWEWIARFKKMQSIGDIVRRLLSRPKILGPAPARGPLQRTVQRFLNGAALFFTCLVLFINLTTMNFGIKLPAFLHPISYGLMLHQVWTAYSPKGHFFNFNNWYVMVGTLKDGTQIDIFRNAAVDWECPEAYCKTYRNSRWSLFLTYATYSGAFNEMNRQHLLRYCSDQWNKRHDSETQVVKVDYYQVTQSIRPKPGPLQKTLLTTYFPFPPANEAAP